MGSALAECSSYRERDREREKVKQIRRVRDIY